MKLSLSLLLLLLSIVSFKAPDQKKETTYTTISTEELKLYNLLMTYRQSMGLPKIPLSKSLTYVAQAHCKDLAINKPDIESGCNAHSWSDQGTWSSCCYTPDHKMANCMWNKPRELTNYQGDGFEIICGGSGVPYRDFVMTAESAIDAWKESIHHNNVILNRDIWADSRWNAIGVGIYRNFAAVWFGKSIDKEGEPTKQTH